MRPVRIGIDVGTHAVKVVWTTRARAGGLQWHVDQRPRHAGDSSEQLAVTLGELLRPLAPRRYDAPVVVAVAESHVRQLSVQVPNLKQLQGAVGEHVQRLFPFERSRCRYRYQLIGQPAPAGSSGGPGPAPALVIGGPGQPASGQLTCAIQVVACDLDGLHRALETLWRVGWTPSQAAASSLALVALANRQGAIGTEPLLLLDLGARHMILAIVVRGRVVFAREVAMGSDDLTEALTNRVMVGQDSLQLSWEDAERLKCSVGIPNGLGESAQRVADAPGAVEGGRLPLATYSALIQPVLEQWLGEIQRTLAFSVQETPEAAPKTMLLCGGGSQLQGLDRWMTQHLSLPIRRLSVQSLLGEDRPAFAVACGLLLADREARLNLLPEQHVRVRRVIRTERAAIKALLLMVLGVWVGIGGLAVQRTRLMRRLVPLEQRWQVFEPVTTLRQSVVTHATLLNTLTGTQGALTTWLGMLAEGFPNPVRLTELTVGQGGEVHMVGHAQPRDQTPEAYVSELAMWLEHNQLCRSVHLGSSQRSTRNAELVDFDLTCQR